MPSQLLIKQMPDDLKEWVAASAKRHRRSMNQEIIMLIEKARAEGAGAGRRDEREIREVLERYRKLPILDGRSADEILGYDEHGLAA